MRIAAVFRLSPRLNGLECSRVRKISSAIGENANVLSGSGNRRELLERWEAALS